MSQLFTSGDKSIGASASASVLPMNIHDWFPLGLTGLISLLPKGLSRVFSSSSLKSSVLQCSAFFMVQPSYIYMITGKTITLTISIFVGKVISLLSNMPFIIITCLKCCRKSKRCGVRRPFSNDLFYPLDFCVLLQSLSCVQLLNPMNQVPLSTGFLMLEYWNVLPFPPPEYLPNSGIKPASPTLAGAFFTTEPLGAS